MKTTLKWLSRVLFVVLPTVFTLFSFTYHTIATIDIFNPILFAAQVEYWAVCLCFWLPFTLIGITIILRWFNVSQNPLKIVMYISGVLFLIFTVVQLHELLIYRTYSAIQYHPVSYIIKGLLTFFIAIFCFLPDKFFKLKWIPLSLSIMAICIPNIYTIANVITMSTFSTPTLRYIINEIITNIFPYVSILLCAQLMGREKI